MAKKVMIVEDELITALYLEQQVRALGYQVVHVAQSGEEAVKFATGQMPDAILMDIRLKGEMDGINAAEVIDSGVPVIFLTAFGDEATRIRASRLDPIAFLEKPASMNELQESLLKALHDPDVGAY